MSEPVRVISALDGFYKSLTAKQRDFLTLLEVLIEEGRPVSYDEVAKAVKVTRMTLYNWRKDHIFMKVAARIMASHADLYAEMMHRAVMRKAFLGSPAHYELYLRRAGEYEGGRDREGDPAAPASGHVVQQVNFYGLPAAPSPEQARAILPGIGSNVIVPTPAQTPGGTREA